MIDGVRGILVRLVSGAVPKGALRSGEVDALVGICVMGISATGTEDPKSMCSQISDPILDHLVSRMDELKSNQIFKPVCQFLLFEWCFRNGHLDDDWRWEWTSGSSGQVHIRPKVPLDTITLPPKSTSL